MVGVAALAVGLVGCSSSQSDTAAPSTQPEATVTVNDPWIPQPVGGVAAMFGTAVNSTDAAVTLVGGSAPEVGMVQIHEYIKEGTKEVMREVPGGLEVPAGGSVEFKPGSYHVMMMKVKADWQPGDTVPVTLNLSDGSSFTVDATVKSREGMDMGSDSMDSETMESPAS